MKDKSVQKRYEETIREMGLKSAPDLRICAGLQAPMLAGIFRTVLLLPEEPMEEQSLRHTLLHELSHYRRKDIWLRTLAVLACAVHWFNPLVWYLRHMLVQDTELACDEALIRYLPKEEYGDYCRTILNSAKKIQSAKEKK